MRLLLVLCLFSVSLPGVAEVAKVGAVYRATNPQLAGNSLVVSNDGVTLFGPREASPGWQALLGVQTYAPVVTDAAILVGSNTGLYALDRVNGNVLWRYRAATTSVYSPLVIRDVVIGDLAIAGATDGVLRAINVKDGSLRWQHQYRGWIYTPALLGNLLVSGGNQGALWAMNLNGKAVWQFDLQADELVYQPVSVSAGLVVASTFSGRVVAVDVEGNLRWQLTLKTPVKRIDPQGDQLLLHHFGGDLSRVEAATGALLGEYHLAGGMTYAASWYNERWWLADDQGRVSAITNSGKVTRLPPLSMAVVAAPIEFDHALVLPVREGRNVRTIVLSEPR